MKHSQGFTLIELVIVIVTVGIIAGIVGFILLGATNSWRFASLRKDILWDGRLAMNRMVREIKEIKNLTSVTTASSSQFRFTRVDDSDITYSLSGTDLNRTESGTSNLLAENVSGLTFAYYNASGGQIVTPTVSPLETDIRRVRINLTLTKNVENIYLQSESVPRNF